VYNETTLDRRIQTCALPVLIILPKFTEKSTHHCMTDMVGNIAKALSLC